MAIISLEGYISKVPNNLYVAQKDIKRKDFEAARSNIIILNRYTSSTSSEVFENIYNNALNIITDQILKEDKDEIEEMIFNLSPDALKQIIEQEGDYYDILMEGIPAPDVSLKKLVVKYGSTYSKIIKPRKINLNKFNRHMERYTGGAQDLGWIVEMIFNLEDNHLPDKNLIDFFIKEEVKNAKKFYLEIYNTINSKLIKEVVDVVYKSLNSEEKILAVNDTSEKDLHIKTINALINLHSYYNSLDYEDENPQEAEKPVPNNRLIKRITDNPDNLFGIN